MSDAELSPKQQQALERQRGKLEEAKAELVGLGFILQGSVTERRMECGKAGCRCHGDPGARHGPYYQWSWKASGRTASVYLSPAQAELCRQWVANHRRAEKILKRMREISKRAARLHNIRSK